MDHKTHVQRNWFARKHSTKKTEKLTDNDDRFSNDNLKSMNQVIDKYKKFKGFKKVELFGFSGGGAMEMLLATQRNDIVKITTFAGNLDTALWVKQHNIMPLNNSLNPADFKESFKDIPQTHYVGTRDETIPPFIAHEFIKGLNNAEVIEVDTNHSQWNTLNF